MVQKHLQEGEIVAPSRQEATAAAEELAVRYLDRDRLQTSVRSAAMHADKARGLVGGRNKTRVRHPERGKDVRAEIGIERLSGDGFDCAPDPVDVDAIFPVFAGIENQRQPQRSELASHYGGHAGYGDI